MRHKALRLLTVGDQNIYLLQDLVLNLVYLTGFQQDLDFFRPGCLHGLLYQRRVRHCHELHQTIACIFKEVGFFLNILCAEQVACAVVANDGSFAVLENMYVSIACIGVLIDNEAIHVDLMAFEKVIDDASLIVFAQAANQVSVCP